MYRQMILGQTSARSPRDLRAISAQSRRDLACGSERDAHGRVSKVQLGRLEPVAAGEGGVHRLELAVLIDEVLELDLINISTGNNRRVLSIRSLNLT